MGNGDYVVNIDTSYVDDVGNTLIGSNDIMAVYYYNATTSGTHEDWEKIWNVPNTIQNHDFSSALPTASGDTSSNWDFYTDKAVPYTVSITRDAAWHSTDLLMGKTVTSSGYSTYSPANLVDYDNKDGWRTSTSSGSGAFAATVDMGSVTNINYVRVAPGFESVTSRYVKDYRIGVATTDTPLGYTIVASGTTISGSNLALTHYIGEQYSRYVKIYIDSNWGDSSYTHVFKISGYYNPDWSAIGERHYNITGGTYSELRQDVNLTNLDYLFFDVRAYMNNAAQVGNLYFKVDSDTLASYSWATTGTTWLDSDDTTAGLSHWSRIEEAVDVSSYTGTHTIKLGIWDTTYHRQWFIGYFDNIQTTPAWSREAKSSTRGSTTRFPDESYVVSDRNGISIIEKESLALWMRFNVGSGCALESGAREIVAEDGLIYLATSRGLVILDFVNNRIWKYDETGLTYRMSIAKRNEYAHWYTQSAGLVLPSNDVYSVSLGKRSSGTKFILLGTGAGLVYIEHLSAVRKSAYTYPIIRTRVAGTRVYYVGGYGSTARVGVVEDLSTFNSTNFSEKILMFSKDDKLKNDGMSGSLSEQWFTHNGELPVTFSGSVLTISGSKTDVGRTAILQKNQTPNRSFVASVDVKINNWVSQGEGGFNFGLESGYPFETALYSDSDHAYMLSAANGVIGQYIENESFNSTPSAQWVYNFLTNSADSETIESLDGVAVHIYGPMSDSYGLTYSNLCGLGSAKKVPTVPSFTAKLKVKNVSMYTPDAGRNGGVVFGLSDGRFLGEGATNRGLAIAFKREPTDPAPIYCTATKNTADSFTWNTTNSGLAFSGDGTSSATYHTWDFTYNSSTKTLYGSVDGMNVGSVNNASLDTGVGIFFGNVGNQNSTISTYFKDFEIEFVTLSGVKKNKYVVQSYDDGTWVRPTASGGTHLSGKDFFATDGTPSAEWHTWSIGWNKTTFSGAIDGVQVSSITGLSLGNEPRVFMSYDMPPTTSGNNYANIQLRNFNVQYDESDTVVSGSVNNIFTISGTHGGTMFNSVYLATTRGINHFMYMDGTSVSGVPYLQYNYGSSTSDMQYPILYGTVNSCSYIEATTSGPSGLMYTGSSRYSIKGWERLKNRPGDIVATTRLSLGCSHDGGTLFLCVNPLGGGASFVKIYQKDMDEDASAWALISQGRQTTGIANIGDSRVYFSDILGNGVVVCVGPGWTARYDVLSNKWLGTTVNLGDGPLSVSEFTGWDVNRAFARTSLFGVNDNKMALYDGSLGNWWGGQFMHALTLPISTSLLPDAVVYSEVDDSIYLMQYGTTGNFFRMPFSTQVWSEALEDCPIDWNFTTAGASCFYRPYDESIYFLMKGAVDSFGRKLVRYDVKEGTWSWWGVDFPYTMGSYGCAVYSPVKDCIYAIQGNDTYRMYRYTFPVDCAPRFVHWDGSEGVPPETSRLARFRKVAFNSGHAVSSDDFSDGTTEPTWFDCLTTYGLPAAFNVSESDGKVNVYLNYGSSGGESIRCQACPLPPCDAVLTAKVKVKDMRYSSTGTTYNEFIFGVSDYFGSPGYDAYSTSRKAHMGKSLTGYNGIWMSAFNRNGVSNRYTISKREFGETDHYDSSQYVLFSASDGHVSTAAYRDWTIDYSHATKTAVCYIDGSLVGSTTFSGSGPRHGMMVGFGVRNDGVSSSGTMDIDVKDLTITCKSDAYLENDWLRINDNDEYGYVYYEKLDGTVISGTNISYETEVQVDTYTVFSSVYAITIGSVEDGNKDVHLAALYTGYRGLGLYAGGDPRLVSSYLGVVDYDWTVRTKYTISYNTDRVCVYLDDSTTPIINVSYDDLVESHYHRVRFGVLNPAEPIVRNVADINGHRLVVSGTWTYDEGSGTSAGAYYGGQYTKANGSASDAVIFKLNDSKGNAELFTTYKSYYVNHNRVPYTVYHSGVVDLPVPDGFANNPVYSVSDNINEGGVADNNCTSLLIDQTRYADGTATSSTTSTNKPSGLVYLGTYTNVDRVVITCSNKHATNTNTADTVVLKHCVDQPRTKGYYKVWNVGYTVGCASPVGEEDFTSGFTVIDMSNNTLLDAYSEETLPALLGDDITGFDVP